jgi:hypothetical protein
MPSSHIPTADGEILVDCASFGEKIDGIPILKDMSANFLQSSFTILVGPVEVGSQHYSDPCLAKDLKPDDVGVMSLPELAPHDLEADPEPEAESDVIVAIPELDVGEGVS